MKKDSLFLKNKQVAIFLERLKVNISKKMVTKVSLFFYFFLPITLHSGLCDKRVFDIESQADGITINDVIIQFAKECKFSVVIKDRFAEEKIKTPIPTINLKNGTLKDIFKIALEEFGLNYEFDGQLLKISYLLTKTFKVDYIGTSRFGESATSIVISSDIALSMTNNLITSTQSKSNLTQHQSTGESQTKTSSKDDFIFWENLTKEIKEILIRPDDDFYFLDTNLTLLPPPIINKGAGLVTVTGSKKQIDRVAKYINSLTDRLKNQVIIDVNILTVTHSDGITTGIDWNQLLNLQNLKIKSDENFIKSVTETEIVTKPITNIDEQDQMSITSLNLGQHNTWTTKGSLAVFGPEITLNQIINFLKRYGEVSSISNPKVMTLNNQPALISVGNIIRYKKLTTLQTATTGGTNTNTNEDYPSVFAGVLLDITPSIYNDEIMLKINPSITKTKGIDVENASQALDRPPNLSTNQLSSMVKLKNGEKVILGGLINKENSLQENKVPLLGDIPLLGYAFKHKALVDKIEEIVIVITPKIVEKQETISLKDLGYTRINE